MDGGAAPRQTLAVGCTVADLERVLEDPSDNVRVSFDAEAPAQAIDPDIEVHGLRERMTVLAVVVATTAPPKAAPRRCRPLGWQGGVSGAPR